MVLSTWRLTVPARRSRRLLRALLLRVTHGPGRTGLACNVPAITFGPQSQSTYDRRRLARCYMEPVFPDITRILNYSETYLMFFMRPLWDSRKPGVPILCFLLLAYCSLGLCYRSDKCCVNDPCCRLLLGGTQVLGRQCLLLGLAWRKSEEGSFAMSWQP
jgi:hypothetical protein